MKKKIFGLLLIVMLTITGIACNITSNGNGITINPGGDNEVKIDLDEVYLNVQSQIANKDNITSDITLPTKFGSVTITWTSDNPYIIDSNGHVNRPEVDTDVILRCTLTSETETKHYQLKVTIKAEEVVISVLSSISDVLTGVVGNSYKTRGTVVAIAQTSFIIKDNTGYVLSYLDTEYRNDLTIGDVVEVEGTTSLYGGAVQFNKPAYSKLGTEMVTYPNPRKLDAASYEALNTDQVTLEYVSLTATLSISGKYYNLVVDGSSVKGSLCAPTIDVTAFDGKKIDITGYFVYVSGSSTKYLYFLATDIKLSPDQGEVPNPELTLSTIAQIKAGTVGAKYKAQAVVVAVSAVSALVQDNTGYILLYFGNEFRKDLAVGDEIVIEGTTSAYKDTVQFSSGKYEKVGTKSVSYPEPELLTGEAMDRLVDALPETKFVRVSGKLIASGNYLNLQVEGTTNQGSIVTPLENLSDFVDKNVVKSS